MPNRPAHPEGSALRTRDQAQLAVVAVGLVLLAAVLIRTAWVCDDAFITFRTADNFVHGYGLRWNVGERVQSYTHPLWMALFTGVYELTRDAYYTSIVLCGVLSALAVLVITWKLARTPWHSVVAFAALLSSKAFVDFSTSGLENALTYLLLAVFLWVYWDEPPGRRRIVQLSLLTGLCLLNRLDLGFLLAPVLLVEILRHGVSRALRPVLVGLLPLVAWEIFATIYYGFPLPNTAYAKLLGADVYQESLFRRGVFYAHATALFDPVTIAIIVVSPLAIAARRQWRDWPLIAGIVLQGLYVTSIGGDFMFGRFFTSLVVWSAALFARAEWVSWKPAAAATSTTFVLLGLAAADQPALLSGQHAWTPFPRYMWFAGEATDERMEFFATTGLFNQKPGEPKPRHRWSYDGLALRRHPQATVLGPIGFAGYFAGPEVHIVDLYGLADPLLARLPPEWTGRIGHFNRAIPAGYLQTIESGINRIEDPDLARYFDRLRMVVSGPVWRRERLTYIASMLIGRRDPDLQRYLARATTR